MKENENKFWGQRQVKSFEAKNFLLRTIKTPPAIPIGIAVMDTGVDDRHSALNDILWKASENFSVKINRTMLNFPKGAFGFDAFNIKDKSKRGLPRDTHSHGTMVAGIIGANEIGVARFAGARASFVRVLTVKTLAANISFETIADEEAQNIIASLDFILEAKKILKHSSSPLDLRIVNMSFGFYRRKNPKFSDALADKIRELANAGILIVASIGNSGKNLDASTTDRDFTYYPAGIKCDGLIAVAATSRSGELWRNSNFGKESVHLAAPGDGIYTTKINNQFIRSAGTSLAAPFVSAAAALLLSVNPQMKNIEIKKCLLENADKNPILDVESGGKLNIYEAVLNAV